MNASTASLNSKNFENNVKFTPFSITFTNFKDGGA